MRRLLPLATILVLTSATVRAAESSSGTSGASKASPRTSEPSSSTKESAKEPSKDATKTKRSTKEKTPSTDKQSLSEDERFTAARKAASEDSKVAELRAKTDSAKSDDAANRAMRSYLKALYSKMRSLEPTLEDRINMTEAAALRALPQSQ